MQVARPPNFPPFAGNRGTQKSLLERSRSDEPCSAAAARAPTLTPQAAYDAFAALDPSSAPGRRSYRRRREADAVSGRARTRSSALEQVAARSDLTSTISSLSRLIARSMARSRWSRTARPRSGAELAADRAELHESRRRSSRSGRRGRAADGPARFGPGCCSRASSSRTTRVTSPTSSRSCSSQRLQRSARRDHVPARRAENAAADDHLDHPQAKARADDAAARAGQARGHGRGDHARGRGARRGARRHEPAPALQAVGARRRAAPRRRRWRCHASQGAALRPARRSKISQAAADAGRGRRSRPARLGGGAVQRRSGARPRRPVARARPAAGRSRTRSCCASRAARTCRPTAPARRATTRSCPRPGSCSAAPARRRTWPARPSRTRWRRAASGTAAPAPRTGSAPGSSASTDHVRPVSNRTSLRGVDPGA